MKLKSNKKISEDQIKEEPLSTKLEDWLKSDDTPTVAEFNDAFGDEGMGLLIILLITPSALPVPTGGITYLFEMGVTIIALQVMLARKKLWLPKKIGGIKFSNKVKTAILPKLISFIKKIEPMAGGAKFRESNVGKSELATSILIIIFTAGAFFAPPFAMLDTLPSMGVIIMGLSLITHSKKAFLMGSLVGLAGLIIEIFFSGAVIELMKRIF